MIAEMLDDAATWMSLEAEQTRVYDRPQVPKRRPDLLIAVSRAIDKALSDEAMQEYC